tara:strand:+ start:29430 stop:30740 length:1311 start_codon:yes stop_codon:yes gene_type:complete
VIFVERFVLGSVALLALSVSSLSLACSSDKEPAEKPKVAQTPEPVIYDAGATKVDEALAEIVATCARAHGEVQVRRKGEAHWSPVQIGATYRAGDWIRTGQKSTTRVQFLGSGALDLEQNTTIIVDLRTLDSGGKGAPLVALEVGVAHGVMNRGDGKAIRPLLITQDDGEIRLEAQSDEVSYRLSKGLDGTEVAVTEGELNLINGEATEELKEGERVAVGRGGFSPITKMIGFPVSVSPGVDSRFLYESEMSIKLSWKKVKGAATYRVQVARDLSFESVIVDNIVTGTASQFVPPEAGVYAWRVAAKDKKHRYGEHGFTRRIFCEKAPPRDLLLAPANGAKVAYEDEVPSIAFSWQSAGSSDSYRLVVGRGSNPLRNTAFETKTATQEHVTKELTAGEYSWGVYVGEENEPIFLKPRRLTIKKRTAPKANVDGIWD